MANLYAFTRIKIDRETFVEPGEEIKSRTFDSETLKRYVERGIVVGYDRLDVDDASSSDTVDSSDTASKSTTETETE